MLRDAGRQSVGDESRRRTIVRLVIVMFWLLVFEGAIRKWVAPQYSPYLYFLRDPVALCIYVLALRSNVFANQPFMLKAGLLFGVAGVSLACLHLVSGNSQYTPVLAAYGFRNYFFYLPMAFVIGRCFQYEDLSAMVRHSMIAMIINAPVALLQFNASPDSPLNVGISSDPDLQFGNLASGSGRVRPGGTFTSVMGLAQLTATTVAFLLWSWLTERRPRPARMWLMAPTLVAVIVALAVSGSRTTFIHSSLVLAASIVAVPIMRGTSAKVRAILWPVLAAVAFGVLFPVLFPEAFETFASRWKNAAETESSTFALGWVGRALFGFYDFLRLFGDTPVLGYGIGMAGNGAVNSGVTINGVSVLRVAEEDWSRHVIELGPMLALLFIVYRVAFGAWLGLKALRATARQNDTLPILLFAYSWVPLVKGQITGHGLANGFGWLFIGFCIAASDAREQESPRVATEADTPRQGRRSLVYGNLMR